MYDELEFLEVGRPRDDHSLRDDLACVADDPPDRHNFHPTWNRKGLRLLLSLCRSTTSIELSTAIRLLLCCATSRILATIFACSKNLTIFSTATVSMQSGTTKREARTSYVSRESREARTTECEFITPASSTRYRIGSISQRAVPPQLEVREAYRLATTNPTE